MAAEFPLEPRLGGAPADHCVGIDAMHRALRQHPGSAGRRAEEGGLLLIADAGGGKILIEVS